MTVTDTADKTDTVERISCKQTDSDKKDKKIEILEIDQMNSCQSYYLVSAAETDSVTAAF